MPGDQNPLQVGVQMEEERRKAGQDALILELVTGPSEQVGPCIRNALEVSAQWLQATIKTLEAVEEARSVYITLFAEPAARMGKRAAREPCGLPAEAWRGHRKGVQPILCRISRVRARGSSIPSPHLSICLCRAAFELFSGLSDWAIHCLVL
jgi:hypothetical protein